MATYVLNLMLNEKSDINSNDLHSRFISVGANTGNNVFMDGLKEQLNYRKEISVFDYHLVSDDDLIIIPSSNFIMHGGNNSFYENIIRFIDNTNCKIVMIGLGAQSSKVFRTPFLLVNFGLNKIKKECFRKISERSNCIGVRGAFTGKCLDLLGISNYQIIGCPSFYKYLDGIYPEAKHELDNAVVMSFSPASQEKTKIFELGMHCDAFYIKQVEEEIVGFESENNIKEMFPALSVDYESLRKYNEKAKIFFSLTEWNQFYADNKVSFAFGTRFHGNMEALRNGIPSLWITHDSRTSELIDFLHLPHVDLKTAANAKNIEELYSYCDMTGIYENYYKMCVDYVDFLEKNEINHKFRV